MRVVVVASVGLVLSVAMLLPTNSLPAAFAQDESASPSASVHPSASAEPSASATFDVVVELLVEPRDPALEWAIAVTGGSPSVDVLELQEIEVGSHGAFTIAMGGRSATVEMTPALPPHWELIIVGCLDDLDPPTEINPIVEPDGFVLEVVTGRRYICFPTSFLMETPDPAEPPRDPTVPPTDSAARVPSVPSSGALPIVIVMMVGVIAGSVLFGLRARRL